MNVFYPELNQIILEMSEGDEDFRSELTKAIYDGLLELKSKYAEGVLEKDEVKIQQIRHKLKPTLAMFEFEDLESSLQEGKEILEQSGFGQEFESHAVELQEKLDRAIEIVGALK